MSGIEIVGILLGAFPLCISAMEHYEDTKKVAGMFIRIRRTHRKDLGKLKDAQCIWRANLRELLTPLLRDDIVDQLQYEKLLANPGGPEWKDDDVSAALRRRLSDCCDRYIEILQEMCDIMVQLAEAVKVDDEQFQRRFKAQQQSVADATSGQQAKDKILVQANDFLLFQAKRTAYAFTSSRREDLLEELETYNKKLRKLLSANDRIAHLSQENRPQAAPISSRALKFFHHADNIYKLLQSTWLCTCRSCANLWLQSNTPKSVQMRVMMPFCHGKKSVTVRLTDAPHTLQLRPPKPKNKGKAPDIPSIAIQSSTSGATVHHVTHQHGSTTTTYTATTATAIASQTVPSQPAFQLERDGLCKVIEAATGQDCLGSVSEGNDEYELYPNVERISSTPGMSLAHLLDPSAPVRLNRVQRYGVALTLASSHLQLHSTPWLKEYWTSEDVLFPTPQTGIATLQGEPYVLARFEASNIVPSAPQKDRSFSTLGIVLLELCFGYRLEEHKMWNKPGYAALKNDPMIRQTIACEWLDEVPGEAGQDYADAVHWTLRQAPAVLKDDKWREEFARNVVQPLQRYYEYLHPTKKGVI